MKPNELQIPEGFALIRTKFLLFFALVVCLVVLGNVWLLNAQLTDARKRIREIEALHAQRELALIEVLKAAGKTVPE
jgi:hypothetical protein